MASASIDVYVKLASGKAWCTHHSPTDTVHDVACKVGQKENIPDKLIRIKYQGKTLDKTKTVGYLGICAETILKVEVIVPKELNIFVKFPDGSCNPFMVKSTDSVSDLKLKIELESGIITSSQIVQFENGTKVQGSGSLLSDSGIVNESVLTVKETSPASTSAQDNKTDENEELDEGTKQALLDSFATAGNRIEVVFCFDTTGSMYSCLTQVRQNLRQTCGRLLRDVPMIRIGIIAHGDYCDDATYVVRYADLTSDVDILVDFAENVPSTGGGDAPEVREKLRGSISRLLRDIPCIRIGLMANGDYCDFEKYIVRSVDLTSDVDALVKFANEVPSTGGGGNGGECYEWAMRKAQQLDWSEDSAKALVMIGDELPHVASYTDQNVFWKDELDVLAGMGVKVYGVQAMNRTEANMFYEEIADRTGGYYLRLNNFSLITDMFLAVCYRESNAEQLDAFVEEVANEGRMTEDTKLFLDKLEQEQPKPETRTVEERERRSVQAAWWCRNLDKGTPEYVYDAELDSFRPYRLTTTVSSGSSLITSVTPRTPVHRSKSRRSRLKEFVLSAFKRK